MDAIAANTVLQDRYEIVKQLGRGGMGAVYLATDRRFGSTVALKQTLVTGDQLRKAFEREARLLNTLQHASMPHVIDYFFEGEGQFLVMQFIPGEDLGHMLRSRGGPFDVSSVVIWLDELLDLLDYLHTHEPPIIHRDIKPENLKVTQRGKVILLDFGLAKGLAEQGAATLSTASVVGYTPAYAALEQIRGLGTDARSDLYSLAATAYHLLTAQLPADALQRADAFVNGAQDPMLPIEFLNREIPVRVSELLHKTLALKRDDRPESAHALRTWLRDVAGDLLTGKLGASAPIFVSGGIGSAGGSTTQPASAKTRPQDAETKLAASAVPVTEHGPTMPFDPRVGMTVPAVPSGPVHSVPPTVSAPEPPRSSRKGFGIAAGLLVGGFLVVLAIVAVVGVVGWQKGWFGGTTTPSPPGPVVAETPKPPVPTGDKPVVPGFTGPGPRNPTAVELTATASSERAPIGTNRYTADMAVDGRRDTAWVEGDPTEGIGEWIEVEMSEAAAIRYIRICPGFFKSDTVWAKNNRLMELTIELSDGRVITPSFADVDTEQVVEVGGGPVTGFRITIDDVYYGGDEIDTPISEISVDLQ